MCAFWNKKYIFSYTFDLCGRVGDKKNLPGRFPKTKLLFYSLSYKSWDGGKLYVWWKVFPEIFKMGGEGENDIVNFRKLTLSGGVVIWLGAWGVGALRVILRSLIYLNFWFTLRNVPWVSFLRVSFLSVYIHIIAEKSFLFRFVFAILL